MKLNKRQVRENSFGWLVKMLSQKIDRLMAEELQSIGLNLKLFTTLMILSEKEGINQTELGNVVGVQGHVTTRTLDKLEERELAKRYPDPNSRRTHLIYLTDEGRALAEKLPNIVRRVNMNFLSTLEEKERHQLIETMKKVFHSTEDSNHSGG